MEQTSTTIRQTLKKPLRQVLIEQCQDKQAIDNIKMVLTKIYDVLTVCGANLESKTRPGVFELTDADLFCSPFDEKDFSKYFNAIVQIEKCLKHKNWLAYVAKVGAASSSDCFGIHPGLALLEVDRWLTENEIQMKIEYSYPKKMDLTSSEFKVKIQIELI